MILPNCKSIFTKFSNLILWKLCLLKPMARLKTLLNLCRKNRNFSKKKDNKKLKNQKKKLPKNKKSKIRIIKINKKKRQKNRRNQLKARNKLIWIMLKNSQNCDKFNFIVLLWSYYFFNFYIFFKLIFNFFMHLTFQGNILFLILLYLHAKPTKQLIDSSFTLLIIQALSYFLIQIYHNIHQKVN